MIASLSGEITNKNPPELILKVGDISYEIFCPISSFYKFNQTKVIIYTHLNIKEDSHTLFGFATINEKQMFRELIKVSGVGPKVALAILSHLSVADLNSCINNEDDDLLAKTPGIGKKTAQKLIIELKGKIDKLSFNQKVTTSSFSQAKNALTALGFKNKESDRMLKDLDKNLKTEEIIRLALKNK